MRHATPACCIAPCASRLAAFLFAAVLLAATFSRTRAQGQITDQSVEYLFGDTIQFRAALQSAESVESARLFFDVEGSPHTHSGAAEVVVEGNGLYTLIYSRPTTDPGLRAFSEVTYHFEVTFEGGEAYTGPAETFLYDDNRFGWEERSEGSFRVHWYTGDVTFAQTVLDVAQTGLEHIQGLLALPDPEQVDIYVYGTAAELQLALNSASENWVAGHADPDLGVMVVVLPRGPDQTLLMEQRIPHELLHILLYQATGSGYAKLPTWLNEGLASAAELYPNPDYQFLLENAHANEALLPIASLCEPFPRDASRALLAYAEAASFTRFIYQNYGASGLQALVDRYADGLTCERGAHAALGVTLSQLERQWRQATFAENPGLIALNNLLPWMVLLLAALGAPLILTAVHLSRRREADLA